VGALVVGVVIGASIWVRKSVLVYAWSLEFDMLLILDSLADSSGFRGDFVESDLLF